MSRGKAGPCYIDSWSGLHGEAHFWVCVVSLFLALAHLQVGECMIASGDLGLAGFHASNLVEI